MNTTSTQNRPASRGQERPSQRQQQGSSGLSLDNIRQRLEDHVKSNPVKAVGQAVAVGYVLRFLPIRFLLSTAMRLAPPLLVANRLWRGGSLLNQGQKEQ